MHTLKGNKGSPCSHINWSKSFLQYKLLTDLVSFWGPLRTLLLGVKICHFSLCLAGKAVRHMTSHDCHMTVTWHHMTVTWLSHDWLSHTTPTHLVDNPWLLQEVLFNHGTLDDTIGRKVNVNVLAKTTRVVVALRFCITKGCRSNDTAMINSVIQLLTYIRTFQDGVGLQNLLFDPGVLATDSC